ncbi:hypothetical protein EVAR_17645_1 [Eumeta japonica]|uniref:Uncharacterized protein n=1 Tax=Eumeta variegata TaxID=151549 RepID=A0A4C1USB1_EUMVA|nr:hypothetical protein EVAR_17645_1 [Eumeta japonica]
MYAKCYTESAVMKNPHHNVGGHRDAVLSYYLAGRHRGTSQQILTYDEGDGSESTSAVRSRRLGTFNKLTTTLRAVYGRINKAHLSAAFHLGSGKSETAIAFRAMENDIRLAPTSLPEMAASLE